MREGHRILIVDDEPNIREGIAMLLNPQGYSVGTAEHGFDALLQLRSVNPELIVSGLNRSAFYRAHLLGVSARFPPYVLRENLQEIQETPCLFCRTPVRYIINLSLSVASPDAHTVESVDAVYPLLADVSAGMNDGKEIRLSTLDNSRKQQPRAT